MIFKVRFLFCPNKMEFIKEPLNVIDALANLSTYIDLVAFYIDAVNVDIVQFIGIIRIMRLFRLIIYLINFSLDYINYECFENFVLGWPSIRPG